MKQKKKWVVLLILLIIFILILTIKMITTNVKKSGESSFHDYVNDVENSDSSSEVYTEKKEENEKDIEDKDTTNIKSTLKSKKSTKNSKHSKGIKVKNDVNTTIEKNNTQADSSNTIEKTTIEEKTETLVYSSNGKCKNDGTAYEYMGGCYIKGTSENNYVWYNGFMWRIMGINEDGTIRLITDENVTSIPYGAYATALTYATNEGYINDWLNDYFYSNLNNTKSIIKEGTYFCSETTNGEKITEGRTKCTSGNEVKAKIGIISYDEFLLAGGGESYINIQQKFSTMTPYSDTYGFYVGVGNSMTSGYTAYVNNVYGIRPVINISSSTTIKGEGTVKNYYVLEKSKANNATGTLEDNASSGEYVKLENHTYRVVSKDSDGIKLILDGYYENEDGSVYLTMFGNFNTFIYSTVKTRLINNVLPWLGLANSDKVVATTWYQGIAEGNGFKYTVPLNADYEITNTKVGLIRLGEILATQSSTMLSKNYTEVRSKDNAVRYWTMNPTSSDTISSVWTIDTDGSTATQRIYTTDNKYKCALRPVIKVKSELIINSGTGTWNNPYEI